MADQTTERVSSSTMKVKKRKLSESKESQSLFDSSESGSESAIRVSTSDAHTDSSSSRSPSAEPTEEHSSSSNELWLSQTTVEQCTSKWTRNILNMLQILPVLTEVYTPMQLLSFAFDDMNNFVTKETVETCKSIILQSRTPLNNLDIDDLEDTDALSCFKLLLNKNLKNQWTYDVDLWDIMPKMYADKLDKLQTRMCKKFQIHGELFAQQLMYMNMAKKKGSITEAMYQKLFEEFTGLFGLTSIAEPYVTCCTIEIGDTVVTSKPDIIFPDLVNSNEQKEDMNIIALCEVKQDFKKGVDKSVITTPIKTRSSSSGNERKEVLITHLNDEVIGQHGGELLTHLPLSSKNNGILGLIVQKTSVTFVYFRCDQVQFDKIKKRENKFASKPVIFFSKPYNYLKASDRHELIEPFLRLGFLQFNRYQ